MDPTAAAAVVPGAEAAGLYVHVPFCAAVCPYCDFAVTPLRARAASRYVDAVAREAAAWGARWKEPFDTVYLGGGTPSALSPRDLARILGDLRAALPVAAEAAIFLEANPEDASAAAVAAWKDLGVHTLSLGVQSFDEATLAFLGRRHAAVSARAAVARAAAAGFATVSVDVIYGLPDDGAERVRADLRQAADLGADHISCYQLSMPEGTRLGRALRRGEVAELGEAAQTDLFHLVHREAAAHGFAAYEVSNFARAPRHRSRHNGKYWRHVPYLGLGPGAHSYSAAKRWWNHRRLDRWLAAAATGGRATAGEEDLGPRELALEAVLLGLRTADGIDLGRFRDRFGLDLAGRNRDVLGELARNGLIECPPGVLRPTVSGLAVADALARALEVG